MENALKRIWPAVPVILALFSTTLLIMAFGSNPILTYGAFIEGAFGTEDSVLNTLAFWIPLLLCATGLLVTFTAGLWNIGVEGQLVMGAIGASWVAIAVAGPNPSIPAWIIIPLEILAAMAAGALWAALCAVLKTRGGIHEIFGGVALNNLAVIFTNYLISNPWQPPRGGSFTKTERFLDTALIPVVGTSRFSVLSLVLVIVALVLIGLALRGSSWGLRLKAMGKNLKAAFIQGVPSEREAITGMMVAGALAGLAGAVRVLSWYDSLRQSIGGGIGFLAVLIVLLAGTQPILTAFIALVFSALLNGGTTVQLRTQLHSALSGVIQGALVLFVLLFGDYNQVFRKKSETTPVETAHE